jgi:hypothetical protein
MFDPEKPCQTRDGRAAHVICKDRVSGFGGYQYPIRARVEHPNNADMWVVWSYLSDGRWKSNEASNNNDLVNYKPN